MEDYRSFIAEDFADWDFPIGDEPCMDLPPMIGADERRMHIRAYEMWLSLLDGRDYPAIGDLDAEALGEFGPHSVLLDFSADPLNPGITYLGRALREEGEIDAEVATVSDVPEQALLARLTEHYAEILANRAPVGFEADYINRRGQPILYRGILMPYSSDGSRIDMIHGVVNWKEAAGANLPADIVQAVTTAFAGPAQPLAEISAEGEGSPALTTFTDLDQPALSELVQDAQELAQEAVACEGRTRNALYRALSLAYDVALAAEAEPEAFGAMIADAGIVPQARAPMTPVVKLVFGRDYDRKRVTEFAAVLTHAHRLCLAPGSLHGWLSGVEGGIKAVVTAERGERRPALKVDRALSARMLLGSAPARAIVDMGEVEAEVVLLVARREADGRLAIVAKPIAEKALVDKALQRFAC